MGTKLDMTFVASVRKCHQDAIAEGQRARLGFETLVSEVQRLEALCEKYEKALTTVYNECSCDTPEVCFDAAKEALGEKA